MCCRFTITKPKKEIEKRFGAKFVFDYQKRFNAAPGQRLGVITNEKPDKIQKLHWGLYPPWITTVKKSGGILNVRDDSLRTKPTFKHDLRARRCLIPADGFFEWKKEKKGPKTPYRITLKGEDLFAFAGLWEENTLEDGTKIKTFAIITTKPNDLCKKIHDRMPVILLPREEKIWLESENEKDLLDLLDPYTTSSMRAYEISRAVNSVENDNEAIIKPA